MKTILKLTIRVVTAAVLLLAGFAVGFPMGQRTGFTTGIEWALVQVDILARETGVSLPVNFEEGTFHVIVKQPPDLYKRAWQLADKHDQDMQRWSSGERTLRETVASRRGAHVTQ